MRGWLAIWLVGLLLASSAAPCVAAARAGTAQPAIAKPFDPCHGSKSAPAATCVQLACQTLVEAEPASNFSTTRPTGLAAFHVAVSALFGQFDAPADPPPRLTMN